MVIAMYPMTDCSSFASALRTLWKDSGLLQEEFAERLAYRRPTVANMISGRHLPSLEFLNTVEEAFPGSREVLEPLLYRERQAREREKEQRARGRQGSGALVREQTERPFGLRPHIERAFERPHVSIDFAGFTGEVLHGVIQEPLDKVRSGRLTPESITIRALLSDTSSPMTLPCRTDDLADDPGFRQRAGQITARHMQCILDSVHELVSLGLVKDATAQMRVHRCTPLFKLYIINDEEVFFGFYPVREHTVTLSGEPHSMYDLMGKDIILFHHAAADSDAQYVEQAREWFDTVWNTISREFTL